MTNRNLISLNVAAARAAQHAYLDCRRLGLTRLAVAWKLHVKEHMKMARQEKADRTSVRRVGGGRFWDW